jgi:hypothetical protein
MENLNPLPFLENVRTITVRGSAAAVAPTGQAGLVIETKEGETIAFLVPLSAIQSLRKSLDEIEQFLTRPQGKGH